MQRGECARMLCCQKVGRVHVDKSIDRKWELKIGEEGKFEYWEYFVQKLKYKIAKDI